MSGGVFWGHSSRKKRQKKNPPKNPQTKQNNPPCFRGTYVPLSMCLSVITNIINNSMSETKTTEQLDPGKGKRAAEMRAGPWRDLSKGAASNKGCSFYTASPVHVDA